MIDERVTKVMEVSEERLAYRAGWRDGRFGPFGSFVTNSSIAAWQDMDRLAYYCGHRDGRRIREMLRVDTEPA
jgi:hypothetical protein